MTIQWSHVALLACAAYVFWRIIDALRLGRVWATDDVCFTRDEQRAEYWTMLILQLAVAAGALWFVWVSSKPKPPGEGARIYAVTAAVRRDLPNGQVGAFRNVRADAQSGLVCGEFTSKGNQRRFFGSAAPQTTWTTLEDQGNPAFETAYARACGGQWVLPRMG